MHTFVITSKISDRNALTFYCNYHPIMKRNVKPHTIVNQQEERIEIVNVTIYFNKTDWRSYILLRICGIYNVLEHFCTMLVPTMKKSQVQ